MVRRIVAEKIIKAFLEGKNIQETALAIQMSLPEIERALRELLAGKIQIEAGLPEEFEAAEISPEPLVSYSDPPEDKGVVIRVDGGARQNPGPAAFGVAVYVNGVKRTEWGNYIGIATNNVAEYRALISALEYAVRQSFSVVVVETDSLLVVRQFRGEFKVKDAKIVPLLMEARSLAKKLDDVDVRHIPREKNVDADAMVNKTLDEAVREHLLG